MNKEKPTELKVEVPRLDTCLTTIRRKFQRLLDALDGHWTRNIFYKIKETSDNPWIVVAYSSTDSESHPRLELRHDSDKAYLRMLIAHLQNPL